MKTLEKISDFVGKYMAIIVLVIAAMALFVPTSLSWVKTSWVNYLLMVVMFGMGLTIKPDDFVIVFKQPKNVIIGCLSQFTIMPLLAFVLGKLFKIDDALLVGLVLVGTCPGGTSSNVMSFLAQGDVALSVGMTSVSTILAPILTPAITYLLLRTTVDIDAFSMFFSIIQVVIVPIGLGFIVNKLFYKFTSNVKKVLPLISVTAIVMIVAGLNLSQRKTIAIEVGMQNSGLASSLATTAFPNLAMATVPGAIFSVWHNISGAIIASIFSKMKDDETQSSNRESVS